MSHNKEIQDLMNKRADDYIRKSYIDYGDLNHKAEEQIREAFICGAVDVEILKSKEFKHKNHQNMTVQINLITQ